MIKFVNNRNGEVSNMLTLPFITKWDGDLYLYFRNNAYKVSQVCLTSGEEQGEQEEFETIEEAIESFRIDEKIVEVELHIVK